MRDEICYVMLSRTSGDNYRIHGIFTQSYMIENEKELHKRKQELKEKTDIVKTYLVPMNHFIMKGSMV